MVRHICISQMALLGLSPCELLFQKMLTCIFEAHLGDIMESNEEQLHGFTTEDERESIKVAVVDETRGNYIF